MIDTAEYFTSNSNIQVLHYRQITKDDFSSRRYLIYRENGSYRAKVMSPSNQTVCRYNSSGTSTFELSGPLHVLLSLLHS